MTISDGELLREGKRVLRPLMAPGARLLRRGDGDYEVAVRDGSARSKRVRATEAAVQVFRVRGWVAGEEGVLLLTDVGQGWFDRAVANESPFAAQHQLRRKRIVTDSDGIECLVTVNEAESPIERLRQRGLIDPAQFEAGEKLRRDFTLALLMPRLAIDLEAPLAHNRGGKRADAMLSDTVLMAKQRFNRAMKAVGPGLSDLLFDICCHLRGLEEAEKAKACPHRSARVVLGIALEKLVMHYGMRITGRGGIRGWIAEPV